jgi:serine/threonine protein kinase
MGGLSPEKTEVGQVADERDPFEALADEFIARRRKGETPSLDEYVARLPERAEEIRELFPAIAAMERWKPKPSTPRQRPGGGPVRERIGEYRLIREIGRGGMGIVYEAEQSSLNRRVAIKVLPGTGWADDRPMQRFQREAKTTASLKHVNIVSVYAVGQEDDLHYYVMPLIVGAGLDKVILELRERKLASFDGSETFDHDILGVARTLLIREGSEPAGPSRGTRTEAGDSPLSIVVADNSGRLLDPPIRRGSTRNSMNRHWQAIARIGSQVADALQHAHAAGVLHRDIKPANLILDAEGVVWVADFGLAKAVNHDDLSRTGDLVGTLRYMAPERFRGESTPQSDLYSLGLTLYELMTLRPAHDVPDRAELIRKIAEGQPTRPREIDPSIPLDLETVVLKSLEPDPARRYASAGEMAADLDRFIDGLAVLARRAGPIECLIRWTNRNKALAALGLLSIVLAIVAGFFFHHWYDPPEKPPRPKRVVEPVPVSKPEPEVDPELEEFVDRLSHPQRPRPGDPGFDGPPPPRFGPGGRPFPPHPPGEGPPPGRGGLPRP